MNFREFYEEHVTFVWRMLKRLGVPDSSIKDAMQDVQIVVFRKLSELDGLREPRNWLFRISFRIAKDYRRRDRAHREVLDDEPAYSLPDAHDNAEANLQRQDDARLFEEALARLEEGQRLVFTLAVVEGMTGEEIARALDLPLGTVYSRLRLARDGFRRAVKVLTARQRRPDGGARP
jgi:RNA polymerase sigma-70 factor (ECF subfamily)